MTTAIEFDHVWKQYPTGGLLRRALHVLRPNRRAGQLGQGPGWAVRDVSFALEPGQSLGIIGRNGAGKTTILRLLAGITQSTAGRIHTRGRVAALVALGAGFHRELTGRENIYLNGVILGLTRAEIRRKLADIVEFAELGEYIDMPVKFYSSGMYARLGFSVAVHVEPEILLVDEVLSVGDLSFQSKSLRRMTSFADQGCTIVFVSHRLPAIATMCNETIWLDRGQVRMHGHTDEVIKAYVEDFDRCLLERFDPEAIQAAGSGEVIVERVVLRDCNGQERAEFSMNEPLMVDLHYRVLVPVRNPLFLVILGRVGGGNLFAANMLLDGFETGDLEPGRSVLRCTFDHLPLLPGRYYVSPQVKRDISGNAFDPRPMAVLEVVGKMADYGLKSQVAEAYARGSLPIFVPYRWEVQSKNGRSSD